MLLIWWCLSVPGGRNLFFVGPDTLLLQVSSESKSLVTHLRFSPDGKQLVVVCGSRVHMLDAFTGKARACLSNSRTGPQLLGLI